MTIIRNQKRPTELDDYFGYNDVRTRVDIHVNRRYIFELPLMVL